MKKKVIGYTQGVFDMFHIGHLNIIKSAKERCDYLVVGVNSDELTKAYKFKAPIIKEDERLEIVSSIKYVDEAYITSSFDKMVAYDRCAFDIAFIGDDHKGEDSWLSLEEELKSKGSTVCYIPYTKNTSSTKLRKVLNDWMDSSELQKGK